MAHAPMISYEEAIALVLARCTPLEAERLPLDDALDHVLAEALVARDTLPPAPMSNRDGYAVRTRDVAKAGPETPVTLSVAGEVPCGSLPPRGIESGEAMRTMTGAIVCDGADAVVMVEDTALVDGDRVRVFAAPSPGQHVRPTGSDVRPGELVLPAGVLLGPAQIALAATLGHGSLDVHRLPRVAVLSTGDELLPPEAPLAPGKIRDANGFSLRAGIRRLGCPVRDLGRAPDRPDRILAMLEEGLDADVLVLSGGASVGDWDFVDEVMRRLNAKVHFDRVAVKPGKPVTFATLGERKLLFGLPGNPVSSLVSFELFCAPALRALAGQGPVAPPRLAVRLAEDVRRGRDRRNYMRCLVRRRADGGFEASLSGLQESFVVSGMARANALLVVEAGDGLIPRGDEAEVILLDALATIPDAASPGGESA